MADQPCGNSVFPALTEAGPRKRTLSTSRQRLVVLMSHIRFGRIKGLFVQSGEPVFDPPPVILRERLLGSRSEAINGSNDDFALKLQVIELFVALDEISDGMIDVLEIRHGLPFRLITSEQLCDQEVSSCQL